MRGDISTCTTVKHILVYFQNIVKDRNFEEWKKTPVSSYFTVQQSALQGFDHDSGFWMLLPHVELTSVAWQWEQTTCFKCERLEFGALIHL